MDHPGNNSGSMQSSSGGDDEEYDSRNESISPLLINSSFGSISNNPYAPPPPPQQPPPLSHHQSHPPPPPPPTLLFDPQLQSHNLHPFSHSPPNLDLVWSRSDPNYSNLGNLTPLSSSFPQSTQSRLGLNQGPLQSVDGNSPRLVAPNSVSDQNQTNVGKNSRKRTRASRRAPTTVLTTDASNFRQMVQEFTGIPSPPFSSSPYSRRLDLFGGGSTLRSSHLDSLGPLYPFRPSAQKVQQNPFVSSSASSSSPSMLLNTISSTGDNDASYSYSHNYPMNVQNPVLNTFQSLLQSNGPHFGTKSQAGLGIPACEDELVMAQHVNPTNLTSEFSMQVGGNNTNLTRSWRGEEGVNDQDHQQLGSFDGNNGGPRNGSGSYKMKGTSNFRPEKRVENVSSRNEGTVDSWICPSD